MIFLIFIFPILQITTNMAHFDNTQVPSPKNSAGKNPFDDNRQKPIPIIRSNSDFKKPRFSSRARIPLSVNRSKLNIPYKSEICSLFQRGKCYYGDNCHFSHTTGEIRTNNQGLIKSVVANEEHLILNGDNSIGVRNVCRWFFSGTECPYGDRCLFLHHKFDGKAHSDLIRIRNFNSGESCNKSVRWKTRLCMKWEMLGSCDYGAKCVYAHGISELQKHGEYAKMEKNRYTSSSKLASKPQNAASLSAEVGKKIAEKMQVKGKRCFLDWDIAKTSRIYADWIDDC